MKNNQIKELVDEIIESMLVLKCDDKVALKKLSELNNVIKTNGSEFVKLFEDKLRADSIELGYCSKCHEMIGLDCTCDIC